jgi:hypothetical protein
MHLMEFEAWIYGGEMGVYGMVWKGREGENGRLGGD